MLELLKDGLLIGSASCSELKEVMSYEMTNGSDKTVHRISIQRSNHSFYLSVMQPTGKYKSKRVDVYGMAGFLY
jgi:hypothetical protein